MIRRTTTQPVRSIKGQQPADRCSHFLGHVSHIQIVPAEVGTHAGLLGGFFVGSFDDTPVIVYAETAVEGITIDKPGLVSKAAQAFERL